MKKALITGVTGQDGAYLAEFLLKKGTPIAMYKPVKLDKINYTVKDEDDAKFIESYKSNLKFQSKFKGSYNAIKG